MKQDSNEFFNDVFGSVSATNDVRAVFSLAECLASYDHMDVSIDYMVSAILYYYRDFEPNSIVAQLYPADDYYLELKKSAKLSNLRIFFSDFPNEKHMPMKFYRPNTSPDVDTLFVELYDYANVQITISILLYVICNICKKTTNGFQNRPFFCNDEDKFQELYSYVSTEFQLTYKYSQKLSVSCGTDMTFNATKNKYDKLIGRAEELEQILRIISKRAKNNPILVGEPGVGKTHIIEALAQLFTQNKVPARLIGKKIVSLNTTELTAGTKYRGDLEKKFQSFMDTVSSAGAIIFIDEIHTICLNSFSESGSLGDMLKPYLLDSKYCIIGTTTPKEYRLIEKDPALARRFDVVRIAEPTISEAIEILHGLKHIYENFHSVTIPNKVIENCVKLSDRYISTSSLPDKALDVLDEACSKLECDISSHRRLLSTDDICEIITKKTGIAVHALKSAEKIGVLNLESKLKAQVIGQDNAISGIVRAIKRATLDLHDENRPIASFLFAGTTGVGKTETAKILASEYFGNPKALIRLDMSEYSTNETVHRLTGSSPGYVGYNEGGQLTNAVKNQPYSVVLFDEIEKAHPDVLNILLQILDDGRLTDNSGVTVNFKNTIIILTTNIGAEVKPVGFGKETVFDHEKTFMTEIRKTLRPELINRLSNIVVYNTLTKTDCEKIVRIYLSTFQSKLRTKGISIKYAPDLPANIVESGYNKLYGAREIKRTFEKMVIDKVTDLILTTNATNIYIDSYNNLSITSTKAQANFE